MSKKLVFETQYNYKKGKINTSKVDKRLKHNSGKFNDKKCMKMVNTPERTKVDYFCDDLNDCKKLGKTDMFEESKYEYYECFDISDRLKNIKSMTKYNLENSYYGKLIYLSDDDFKEEYDLFNRINTILSQFANIPNNLNEFYMDIRHYIKESPKSDNNLIQIFYNLNKLFVNKYNKNINEYAFLLQYFSKNGMEKTISNIHDNAFKTYKQTNCFFNDIYHLNKYINTLFGVKIILTRNVKLFEYLHNNKKIIPKFVTNHDFGNKITYIENYFKQNNREHIKYQKLIKNYNRLLLNLKPNIETQLTKLKNKKKTKKRSNYIEEWEELLSKLKEFTERKNNFLKIQTDLKYILKPMSNEDTKKINNMITTNYNELLAKFVKNILINSSKYISSTTSKSSPAP